MAGPVRHMSGDAASFASRSVSPLTSSARGARHASGDAAGQYVHQVARHARHASGEPQVYFMNIIVCGKVSESAAGNTTINLKLIS